MGLRLKNYLYSTYKTIWIPILLVFVVLPVYVYMCFLHSGRRGEIENIMQQGISLFYPVGVILSATSVHSDFVDGRGREILYLHQRSKVFENLTTLLFYVLCMGLQQCFFWRYLKFSVMFFFKNVLMLACFVGVCYFGFFFFHNMTQALVFAFIFFLITLTQPMGLFDLFHYNSSRFDSLPALLLNEKEYLITGGLGWLCGIFANKYYCWYD